MDAETVDAERFGPYRIEKLLGRGGMGEVYQAYDESHKRTVALKLLSPHLAADEGYRARFRRESELAARLREAHVIPIHRYGEIDGRLFIDMRLVEGSDLAAVLEQEGLLPPQRAVAIISQVAKALDAAHADRLIHRDVKPSNVLVSDRGEDSDDDFVYLVDFGIARATEDEQGLTKTGSALGSFDYMAPERFLEGTIDRRTDVYSLACLLYECLTGNRPFPGDALPVLMYGHLNSAPPLPSRTVGGIPQALDEVLARGMAKRPDDRFPRAGDLASAARRALRTPPEVPQVVHQSGPVQLTQPPPSVSGPHSLGPGPANRPPSYPGLVDHPGSGPIQPAIPGFSLPRTGGPQGPSTGPSPLPGQPGLTRGRAALVVGLVAVLVAAATIWALLLTGSDPPVNTATSTSMVSATTTRPTIMRPPDPPDRLLALVPADFPRGQCDAEELEGDGDIATISCGASRTQPGPAASGFYLYPDAAAVRESFETDMQTFDLEEISDVSCTADAGYSTYEMDGETAGFVACRVADNDDAVIQWTQDEFGFYGVVNVRGGEPALAGLFEWWTAHHPVSE